MNNDLKPLFRKLDNSFKLVSESEDLNDLKDLYTQFELVRDEIIEWIEKRNEFHMDWLARFRMQCRGSKDHKG